MKFSDIIAQEEIKKRLLKSVSANRISHAQLFTGPAGSGKFAMALAYAQYINCKNRTEEDSCGVCPSCVKFSVLAHPDLHFIFPLNTKDTDKTKPLSINFLEQWREYIKESANYPSLNDWYSKIGVEKKQGNINAEEADTINKTLAYKSYEADYKTLIIWMADKMNITSANKLLKTLEEPAERTLIILITEGSESLLPTILSRMQVIKFPKLTENDVSRNVLPLVDNDKELAEKIAFLSDGNYIEALKYVENFTQNKEDFSDPYFELFRDWLRQIYVIANKLKNFETLQETILAIAHDGNREKIKEFFAYALTIFEVCLNVNIGNTSRARYHNEELEFIMAFSKFIHPNNITYIENEINKAIMHIERNANAQIVITDLSITLSKLLRIPEKIEN